MNLARLQRNFFISVVTFCFFSSACLLAYPPNHIPEHTKLFKSFCAATLTAIGKGVHVSSESLAADPESGAPLYFSERSFPAGFVLRVKEEIHDQSSHVKIRNGLEKAMFLLFRASEQKVPIKIELFDGSEMQRHAAGPLARYLPQMKTIVSGQISKIRMLDTAQAIYGSFFEVTLEGSDRIITGDEIISIRLESSLKEGAANPNSFVEHKTGFDFETAVRASDISSFIPKLRAKSAGVYGIYEFIHHPEFFQNGVGLGSGGGSYKDLCGKLGLETWEQAYQRLNIPRNTDHATYVGTNHDVFLETVAAENRPIVFFVPRRALTYSADGATIREITWILENPDKLKNFIFVFGADDIDRQIIGARRAGRQDVTVNSLIDNLFSTAQSEPKLIQPIENGVKLAPLQDGNAR